MNIPSRVSAFFGLLLVCIFLQITEAQSQLFPPLSPCSSRDPDTNNNGLTDICDIDGLELIRDDPDGRYELRRSLDFNDPNSYRDPNSEFTDSWTPIEIFEGEFNGAGHTISNLRIYPADDINIDDDFVGLFTEIGSGGEVGDIGLLNVDISAENSLHVGGLAGFNSGEIRNTYVINDDGFRIEADRYVGGLVGENASIIVNSYTTVEVHGNQYVGGLVGFNSDEGMIRNSRATGILIVGKFRVGGLVGENLVSIIGSYADGSVRETTGDSLNRGNLGGLVGLNGNGAAIRNSYAVGTIEGSRRIGGLIGENQGVTINSYAKNKVNGGGQNVGGLVGLNGTDAAIRNSYATGDVVSTTINYVVGGLVGRNAGGTILNTYATGDVSVGSDETDEFLAAGGLIGFSSGSVENSYAIGLITAGDVEDIGSLVGLNSRGTIKRSYARNERRLVGFNQGRTRDVQDSFTTDTRILQLPIDSGVTSTEIYYKWSENDWDFLTQDQYPTLKHAVGSGDDPACGKSTELPDCGTPLSGQPISLYTYIRVFLEGLLQTD